VQKKRKKVANEIAKAILFTRQGKIVNEENSTECVGRAIALHTWDTLFAVFGIDHPQNLTEPADSSFLSAISGQIEKRGSMNGELIRQYLNTVLRGLPPSNTLREHVSGIPSQDVALSHTGCPDCAYDVGKVNNAFRRIFLSYYNESIFQQVRNDLELNVMLVSDALNDLYQFQRSMEKVLLWKYPQLLKSSVRGIVGDICEGRIQDSRRGGKLTKTSDPVALVQSCVEDAVLDPLLDTLYLIYLPLCSKEDKMILQACEVDKNKWAFAYPLESTSEMHQALLCIRELYEARTPTSKMKYLNDAFSFVMSEAETIIERRHVATFVWLIRLSCPWNLSTQYKFLIDTLTENHMNIRGRIALAMLGTAKLALLRVACQGREMMA